MNDEQLFPVPEGLAETAWADNAKYLEMYKQSVDDPEGFWGEQGKCIDWIKPYTLVKDTNFTAPGVSIKWFYDGTLNASYNCIDRHLGRPAATRPPSSGKATIRTSPNTSPTGNFTRSLPLSPMQ